MSKELIQETSDHVLYKLGNKKYELFIGQFRWLEKHEPKLNKKLLHELNNVPHGSSIHIYIDSPGGILEDAIGMINIIKNNFNNITTEIIHLASSAATVMFLIGDRRIVNTDCRFMAHSFKISYNLDNSELIQDRVDFSHKFYLTIFKKYYNTFLSKKKIKKLMLGKEYWYDSNDMLEKGIATHLRENGKLIKYTRD